ncbi:Strictosidine synthase [Macleaya cordata]|uniref:Strictosidine synthase n=1 Tax=Macleaya cordata TaxID=56857 RepID=A0A200QCW7_MACCD|nr:Strictosidine synthase [Macleaya cordata]
MPTKRYISAVKGVVFASLLAFLLQILFFSPIDSPDLLELPPAVSTAASSDSPWNNNLQRVVKLGEGWLKDPEGVCVDKEGTLYTATRDGWIKRFHKNGTCEDWRMIGGNALLGITTSTIINGDLLVCDATKGLLKVNAHGVTVLTSEIDGSKISFADDVIEASDAKPHGRVLKYDPSTRKTSILIDGLCFPNGITLSQDQDFLVVCETWKFRCLKHWLKGENRGKIEIFIDNLPGGPDNINLAPDGSFWIALLQLTSNRFEFVHTSKIAKYLIAPFPKLIELVKGGIYKRAMVVNVGADGKKIIRKFDDWDGKVMSFVTSAVEDEGHLYLGSLNSNFIGKLKLN